MCACFILFFTGAKEDDYVVDDELNKVIVEESSRDTSTKDTKPEDPLSDADTSVKTSIGSISFVSCATGEDAMKTLSSSGVGDPLSSEEGQYQSIINTKICYLKDMYSENNGSSSDFLFSLLRTSAFIWIAKA